MNGATFELEGAVVMERAGAMWLGGERIIKASDAAVCSRVNFRLETIGDKLWQEGRHDEARAIWAICGKLFYLQYGAIKGVPPEV